MSKFKVFASGAEKDTSGKLPYHLITKEMVDGLAEGLRCGQKKGYGPHNWQAGLPISEGHLAAALRHIFKYMNGEDLNEELDKEGKPFTTHHLANALVHIGMALTQAKRGRTDLDDRYKK